MAGMFGSQYNDTKVMIDDLSNLSQMNTAAKASSEGVMKPPKGEDMDAGSWWAWLSGYTRQKTQENVARVQEELASMGVDTTGLSPEYQQSMLEGIQQAQAYRDKWNITTALGDAPTMLEEQGVFPQTSVEQPVGVTEESLDAGETPEKPSLMDRAISMFTPSEPEPDSVDTSKPEAGLMSPAEITTSVNDPTQALLERIAIGEGAKPELLKLQEKHGIGTTQYDMVYGFGDYVVPSKPVSEMTMKEVFDYQKELINATKGKVPGTNLGTSAVGKYQFVKTSLFGKGGTADKPGKNSWADKLNLKADTVFTPEIQEKLGMLVLKEAGYNSYIRGKKSEESFLNSIASKWASVEGSTANQHIATKKADLRPILADIKSLITTREDTNRETSPRPMLRPTE